MLQDIHVGNELRRWLRTHNITWEQFAEAMGTYKTKVGRIMNSPTIETEELYKISKTLQFNFFEKFWGDDKIDEFGDTLQDLHIGQEIDNYLKSKDITQAKLAESMGVLPSQVTRIIKKHSIDSGKLTLISNILDHNFFLDFYGNYEETSDNLAIQVGLYMGKYNKLLLEYEEVNRQLLDSRVEAEKLKKEITELKIEINDLREENSKLKSGS